jgi:hypothetical protein
LRAINNMAVAAAAAPSGVSNEKASESGHLDGEIEAKLQQPAQS